VTILIAVVAVAAAIVYMESGGGTSASDAAAYRHSYSVGKRDCAATRKQLPVLVPVPDSIGGTTFGASQFHTPSTLPARYRKAMVAGCRAAESSPPTSTAMTRSQARARVERLIEEAAVGQANRSAMAQLRRLLAKYHLKHVWSSSCTRSKTSTPPGALACVVTITRTAG
jgi:hypothetical protein